MNYVSRRICALEGSSVNISSKFSYSNYLSSNSKKWYKIKQHDEIPESLTKDAGRVEFNDNNKDNHMLIINDVKKNDSAEYSFTHNVWRHFDSPGVILVVTGNTLT